MVHKLGEVVEGIDGVFAAGLDVGPHGAACMMSAQTGFADVVVWNVGETFGAKMDDLGVGQSRQFVCVEAAAVGTPITIEPGSSWTGSQTLAVNRPLP